MSERVTIVDLRAAVEWLDAYEAAPDEDARWKDRVGAMLAREANRRIARASARAAVENVEAAARADAGAAAWTAET